MAQVYDDIPEDILKIIQQVDTSKVDSKDIPKLMKQLHDLASKYINIRKYGGNTVEMDIPQEAAEFLNRYDFANVSLAKKILAKPIVMRYLKENNLLK